TKLHEQVARGSLAELATMAADGTIPARGEVVIVVGWSAQGGDAAVVASPSIAETLARVDALVAAGSARGDAARRVAAETGIPRRALYRPEG
ncbi:MAG TPA: hypothetical protein VGM28_04490, partial [Candidatus Limnocylindrales bacterium]